jgi:hypothetical protein
LLGDALNFVIFISLKFGDEIEIIISFDNLMNEDASVVLDLIYLLFNIKNEVVGAFNFFSLSKKI